MCLKCTDCNYIEFRNQERTVDSSNLLQNFHQNIRWLRSKTNDLINSLETDNINTHVLCFSEHHMEEQDLLHLTLPGYILGSSFCLQNLQKDGVCIFVHKDMCFSKINTSHNCKEKDLEICSIELETGSSTLIILSLYRVSTKDFNQFIKNLDDALKHPYEPKVEFLICGDINTDYLIKSSLKKQLASLLTTYNMLHTVNFATRIQYNLRPTTDNIFVDNSTVNLSSISPTINGLLDHVAQILTIKNTYATVNKFPLKQRTRLIDNETIMNYWLYLPPPKKKKTWECLYRYIS